MSIPPSNAALTFSVGGDADVEAIVALIESAYRGDTGLQGWTTETLLIDGQRTDAEEISARMQAPNARFLCAWEDDQLRGCCLLEEQSDAAYFGMFAVSPRQQGRGIGDQVLAAAEACARHELHAKKMTMSVIWLRTELIAWYERRGYRKTGEELPFPYGDPRAGLPRRDDLYFIVLEKPLAAP